MKRRVAEAILRCLHVSGASESALDRLREISDREWQEALPWLDASGLALYFWQRVSSRSAELLLPPSTRTYLEHANAEHRARVRSLVDEFCALNILLKETSVPYAVLKGFSLVPEYCPDPALRVQYDHDFLIRPEGLDRVEEALRSAGYQRKESKEDHAAVYRPPHMQLPAGPLNPYSARLARPVEIHWSLWGGREEGIDLAIPPDTLERIAWKDYGGVRFPALSREDALLFQALHSFRHILHNWCRLSVFLELARFLKHRSRDASFWQRYAARVEAQPRLGDISSFVFMLSGRLLGAPVPPEFSAESNSGLASVLALWVERYGFRSALENFRGTKSTLFLHREFASDAHPWQSIWRRRLFPLQRPNRLPQGAPAGVIEKASGLRSELQHWLRRISHHLALALRYAWEYPRWRRSRDKVAGERPMQQPARHPRHKEVEAPW